MKTTKEEEQPKYGVVIEIDDLTCLADDEKLKEILSQVSLRGKIFSNICFAQSDDNALGMVKKFALEYEEDFKPFAEAVINIPGVKNIKKGDGPWTRTWKENRQLKKENQRIQQEKEKRQKEYQIQRQKDLKEFLTLREESKQRIEQQFGPEKDPKRISWSDVDVFSKDIKNCEVEFYFVLSDPLLGGFLQYTKEIKSCTSIGEVLDFFTVCINTNLIAFYHPIKHVRDIPVSADLKEQNGKKAMILTAGCGKPTFQMGYYALLITEN